MRKTFLKKVFHLDLIVPFWSFQSGVRSVYMKHFFDVYRISQFHFDRYILDKSEFFLHQMHFLLDRQQCKSFHCSEYLSTEIDKFGTPKKVP